MDSESLKSLKDKLGSHVSNLFFSYHSEHGDRDFEFVPTQVTLRDPDELNPETKTKLIVPSTVHAALTHERVLLEGERIMKKVANMFMNESNKVLRLRINSMKEQFNSEILKINELVRTYKKNEREKYDLVLENSVKCIKNNLADILATALESVCINHQNDVKKYSKYVLKNELEKLKEKCCISIEKALNEQHIAMMRLVPFMIENETLEIKEMMDTEVQKHEKAMNKKLDVEYSRISSKLRQAEHFHTNEMLQTIVTGRLECWLSSQVNKSDKKMETNRSGSLSKSEFDKLQNIIRDKEGEIEHLKKKTQSMTEEMKFLLTCKLNEPLNQVEHLFQANQIKCYSKSFL